MRIISYILQLSIFIIISFTPYSQLANYVVSYMASKMLYAVGHEKWNTRKSTSYLFGMHYDWNRTLLSLRTVCTIFNAFREPWRVSYSLRKPFVLHTNCGLFTLLKVVSRRSYLKGMQDLLACLESVLIYSSKHCSWCAKYLIHISSSHKF